MVSSSLLSALQARILRLVVAARLDGLFLSGGAALGAFHLGHRGTSDLDLFTRDRAAYDRLVRQFVRLVEDGGLSAKAGQAGPGFHRFAVSDGTDTVPVDLVLDTAPALEPTVLVDGLAVDSLADIAANKLTTIVSRCEIRDYVDLFVLERHGIDLVALLPSAQRKDAGAEAATLAFVLSDVKVNRLPEELARAVSAEALQAFIDDLRRRFARAAFPRK